MSGNVACRDTAADAPEKMAAQVAPANNRDMSHLIDNPSLGYGDFWATETQQINVLLVGRSQSGKTTIVEGLKNPQVGRCSTGFSDTRDAQFHTLIVHYKATNQFFQLNLLDTPGLKEIRKNGEPDRTDDVILSMAQACVERNLTTLHAVCFVSPAGHFHANHLEAFERIKEFLGDRYSANAMLLQTHCESLKDATIAQFEEDIRTHPKTKDMFEYCKLGIFRYGALGFDKIDGAEEVELQKLLVKSHLVKIERMRSKLLQAFIDCADKGVAVTELQSVIETARKKREDEIQQLREQLKHERELSKKCPIM